MSDEARPPEGEAHGPTASASAAEGRDGAAAPGAGSGGAAAPGAGSDKTAPGVGLEKTDAVGETAAEGQRERGSWASPASDGASEPAASAEDVPFAPSETLVAHDPQSWPPPSVHDQRTVTSMPGAEGAVPGAEGAVSGAGGTAPGAGDTAPSQGGPSSQPWANPFAPPGGSSASAGAVGHSFAPPSGPVSGANDPFGPPEPLGSGPAADPFAPPADPAAHAQHGHVPPPPIAPDGPGQVPYGYPGGYGHPAGAYGQPAGAYGHANGAYGQPGAAPQGYYGWSGPGMQPLPSNGMGTAGLVLGVLAALVFCLWPLAIILGILGVIFGAIGRGKARRGVATNPGQALAGIICGVAGIALGIGMIVLLTVT